jgi:N-acetylglucosamine-6-phosphate deacetylase
MTRTIECQGFFDLQVNGFAGVDFNDPLCTADDLARAIRALRATGVTRFLPTLITSTFEAFSRCARLLAACDDPAVAGLHMEGPYIAAAARGAHTAEQIIAPSVEDFRRRQDAAGGRILLVTLAPELPGALALTEWLVSNGVRVAIGHSAASPDEIRAAVSAGATMSTHLGNGCPRDLPRHPNLIWEQLAADQLIAGLIVDGHHLAPSVVKTMVRAKTAARVVLVTDAVAAAGQPAGRYRLGDIDAELTADGRVLVRGTSTLAGAALTMDVAVGNTVRFTGMELTEVLPLASTIPAAYVGCTPDGRITASWDDDRCSLRIDRVD